MDRRHSVDANRRPSTVSFTNFPTSELSHHDRMGRDIHEPKSDIAVEPSDHSPPQPHQQHKLPFHPQKKALEKSTGVSSSESSPHQPPQTTSPSIEPTHIHPHMAHAHTLATTAADYMNQDDGKVHILLAVTGSIATIKIPLIIGKLKQTYKSQAEIQLIVTESAEHFMTGLKIPPDVKVWHDYDEWNSRRGQAETMLHVQLRRWADILLIAPLSANTLSKIANGICNNLVTSVIRSWNPAVPILIAPAMNTHMYTNPMTKKHLQMIKDEFSWVETLKPIEKVLVCGDIGMGGMREWSDIVDTVIRQLGGPPDEEDEDDDDSRVHEEDEDDDDDADEANVSTESAATATS